eukprot:932836-Prymnesium_polylepis.2
MAELHEPVDRLAYIQDICGAVMLAIRVRRRSAARPAVRSLLEAARSARASRAIAWEVVVHAHVIVVCAASGVAVGLASAPRLTISQHMNT